MTSAGISMSSDSLVFAFGWRVIVVQPFDVCLVLFFDGFPFQFECIVDKTTVGCPRIGHDFDALRDLKVVDAVVFTSVLYFF